MKDGMKSQEIQVLSSYFEVIIRLSLYPMCFFIGEKFIILFPINRLTKVTNICLNHRYY